MLLSHETVICLDTASENIIGHMCYAASKLWNVCNYERNNYKELGLTKYPDWYYQKSVHKDNMWYKSLPSQTAQEVCKLLDKSWKSFYRLQKTGGIVNPRPPKYKQSGIAITYMQNGIVHEAGSDTVRLTLPKALKVYMSSTYGISNNYLFLKNVLFQNTDVIKQIKIYPPKEDGSCRLIVIYEVADAEILPDNGRYLSIDLGLHNIMTCYDNSGKSFIPGRKYLAITHRYDKEIARVQSQWSRVQSKKDVKYPKPSKHLLKLYEAKRHTVKDYLHKVTRYVADYCKANRVNSVVIGDITGIRKDNDLGSKNNQQLHSLPYAQIYTMLEYKLKLYGIRLIKQEESYSSQCSPKSETVSKESVAKSNRVRRGLYVEGRQLYNADAVGAYNILRKYCAVSGAVIIMPVSGLSNPEVVKAAV